MLNRLCKAAALAVIGGVGLVGCAHNTEAPNAAPTGAGPSVAANADLAAGVPAAIRTSGELVVGIAPPYTPLEFVKDGKVVGFDVDLFDATAKVLGLRTTYRQSEFKQIIPAVTAGTYNVGNSSFTDNKKREKTVDFVTYFSAGVLMAAPTGKNVDPNNACGLSVAVHTGSFEDTDQIPALSKACTTAGKPAIERLQFSTQDGATNALVLGKADAMSADSPVTAYAIKQSEGKLATAGRITQAEPYGWAFAKGSTLVPAVQKALQTLIDNGTYSEICKRWGLQGGAIPTAKINDGQS